MFKETKNNLQLRMLRWRIANLMREKIETDPARADAIAAHALYLLNRHVRKHGRNQCQVANHIYSVKTAFLKTLLKTNRHIKSIGYERQIMDCRCGGAGYCPFCNGTGIYSEHHLVKFELEFFRTSKPVFGVAPTTYSFHSPISEFAGVLPIQSLSVLNEASSNVFHGKVQDDLPYYRMTNRRMSVLYTILYEWCVANGVPTSNLMPYTDPLVKSIKKDLARTRIAKWMNETWLEIRYRLIQSGSHLRMAWLALLGEQELPF